MKVAKEMTRDWVWLYWLVVAGRGMSVVMSSVKIDQWTVFVDWEYMLAVALGWDGCHATILLCTQVAQESGTACAGSDSVHAAE